MFRQREAFAPRPITDDSGNDVHGDHSQGGSMDGRVPSASIDHRAMARRHRSTFRYDVHPFPTMEVG